MEVVLTPDNPSYDSNESRIGRSNMSMSLPARLASRSMQMAMYTRMGYHRVVKRITLTVVSSAPTTRRAPELAIWKY